MDALLEAAKTSWKAEGPNAGERTSLPRTGVYLGLASDLLQRGMGPATTYLRFYLTSFVSKTTLQSLSDDAQCLIIRHIADALKLLLESTSNSDERTQMIASAVNGSGFLLMVCIDSISETVVSDSDPRPSSTSSQS